MPFDLERLIAERRGEKVALFERYLNPQLSKVLKTLGFDADYVRGEGAYLFDAEHTRYLDLLSGFGVFALGRNHPVVIGAIEQAMRAKLAGLVQLDVSLLAGLLAERLVDKMPWLDRLFFCNSGAEAVEAAIKFARASTGRSKIIYCDHAFHGLTYGALSLCGDDSFRERFEPMLPDCVSVPFNDLEALARALANKDAAAFIVEPIQGKGVILPDDGYLAEAVRLCRQHGALFIADEIQTGLGRTGRFLASEYWGVEADMVLLAKALSGGFVPIGAVAMRRETFDKVFDRMERAVVHGSTFSKNDLAMAAGLATLSVMDEEKLIERADQNGQKLIDDLKTKLISHQFVRAVRGKGMMIAIEFGPPKSMRLKAAYSLVEQASKGLFCQLILMPLFERHRILAQVAGHGLPVIKLLPPLVINDDDIQWIGNAFDHVIRESENLGAVWQRGKNLAKHAMSA
ncbi:MAG: aspartate aminotransferase family protein [Geminicoccaceae bacterium]